ncbi:MAG: DUF1707 and DUF2154 domain-containing protein [Gemmatimonadaceae bacterium]|nr:DUF1707 and DUF2154 domain-containing protein [Gemmatimonadaceae bacterium]
MTTPSPTAPSIESARTRVVDLLSAHFAHDGIEVEELDRRLDLAYQARTIGELEVLVQDVPAAPAALARISAAVPVYDYDAEYAEPGGEESERILAIMSETRRDGLWVVPRRLEVVSVMSETVLDLRDASLLPGVTDIAITGVMTQVTIIVPDNVRVINRLFAFMATARDRTWQAPYPEAAAPVIRIDGWAVMAEVVVKRGTA